MVTNQRSILLQRAMRAEQARKIAEDDATRAREALREAQAAIVRLQAGAALASKLTPTSFPPAEGRAVRLVKTLHAVWRNGNWYAPHSGLCLLPDSGTYWVETENENEL